MKNSPCESGRIRGLLLLVSKILLQLFDDITTLECGDLIFDRGSMGNLKTGCDIPERNGKLRINN